MLFCLRLGSILLMSSPRRCLGSWPVGLGAFMWSWMILTIRVSLFSRPDPIMSIRFRAIRLHNPIGVISMTMLEGLARWPLSLSLRTTHKTMSLFLLELLLSMCWFHKCKSIKIYPKYENKFKWLKFLLKKILPYAL